MPTVNSKRDSLLTGIVSVSGLALYVCIGWLFATSSEYYRHYTTLKALMISGPVIGAFAAAVLSSEQLFPRMRKAFFRLATTQRDRPTKYAAIGLAVLLNVLTALVVAQVVSTEIIFVRTNVDASLTTIREGEEVHLGVVQKDALAKVRVARDQLTLLFDNGRQSIFVPIDWEAHNGSIVSVEFKTLVVEELRSSSGAATQKEKGNP